MLLRRTLFPLRLVAARLAAGGRRVALVAVGVVAGAAVLAAVLAGRLVMQDRSLALATARLDPADRVVEVSWSGATNSFAPLNRAVAPLMRRVTGTRPAAAMLFREASVQGRLVNLRAADDLPRWVRLVSGRMPSLCVPTHCEVLRLEGSGPIPSTRYLHLIEVGHAVLEPGTPFAPYVLPAPATEMVARAVRYHTPQPSPVVIANGVAGLSATPELETFYRSYAWFVPVNGGDVHPWAIDDFRRKIERLTAQVDASSALFEVTAPTDQLAAAASASTAAARRLLLLGGEGGALLLAFTILAAAALRRDVGDARRRLTWFGARRWQIELFTFAEAAALAAAGTVVGWVVGGGVAALVARRAGSPAGAVVTHALLSSGGVAAALCVALAAAILLYATVRAPSVQLGRLALTPLDVAALGALAVVVAGWARGSVHADQLTASGGGTGAFLLLVPALLVFVAAVAAARLLAPGLRALGRGGRRGPIALRLAANSLARNPGHAAVAATFLVASLGLALFAVAYRATLIRGQHDEANYTVPASFVLTEDLSQLVPVLHGAPATAYPFRPLPVIRLSGNVPSGATFGFLGVPASQLTRIGGWRRDFASQPLRQLARAITPPRNESLRTTALPPGRRFTLPATGSGDRVAVRAFFRSKLDDYVAVPLGQTPLHGGHVLLHGRIPFRHATLAELELDIVDNGRLTANGGLGIQPSAKGEITFGDPRVDGRPVHHAFAGWIGTGGVSGGSTRVGYVLTPERTGVFRPLQPTDGTPIPVLATPGVAAEAGPRGVIPLQVEGEQVPARLVGVVRRFPSIVGDAVVADRAAASTLLDSHSPGLGTTDELWLDVPASHEAATARLLAHRPFTQLSVQSHAAVLAQLEADPLARGALYTLAGTAGVALLLALVGLLLAVVGDMRDERGELFDLEAQGAAPATIRAHLRLRALLVAAFGVAGGMALGAVLSALVVSLVAATASASEPEPPLRLALDLPVLALAAAAYVVLAAALVGAATALRGRAPARAAEVDA
ncbi:MAG TPA: FtsX-like permease family protein [Gaiellaceae bacterium]|nr:FtsX-like permease family protein [Gaiellaceae bacterium]